MPADMSRAKSVENIRRSVVTDESHKESTRRLRAVSEFDLKAQLEVEVEEEERGRGGRVGDRKYSEPSIAVDERVREGGQVRGGGRAGGGGVKMGRG